MIEGIPAAIFLGLLQGITEFLPISSSGHLALAEYFFGIREAGLTFDIALHFGTLVAVGGYFHNDFWAMARALCFRQARVEDSGRSLVLAAYIVVATIPGVFAGLILADLAVNTLRQPLAVAVALALGGVLLLVADRRDMGRRNFGGLQWRDVLWIGLSQALAVVPGASRSGITITAGLLVGLNREAAARFSFLLSAPIILGAGVYRLPAVCQLGTVPGQLSFFGAGFVAAALSGYLVIALLMKFIRTRSYAVFAYYRLLLAVVIGAISVLV